MLDLINRLAISSGQNLSQYVTGSHSFAALFSNKTSTVDQKTDL